MATNKHLSDKLWDLWCLCSVLGIWPRFIEPNSVATTRLSLALKGWPKELDKLKVLQFSDIHLNAGTTDYFLRKVRKKIQSLKPDLLVFTGDFLCYARFPDKDRLKAFFSSLPVAPYGNYAILGNHDYQEYALVNSEGDYDISGKSSSQSVIGKGFERLFQEIKITKQITAEARNTPLNSELISMIKSTPFRLLHNETVVLPIQGSGLNLCGLGEYMIGRMKPEEAFEKFDPRYPGIVLLHNPDGAPHLSGYPGDLILCGHSHGGQINLPWIWKKFVVMENLQLTKGLALLGDKQVYINRGLGGVFNFRWFCLPELTLFELRCAK